MKDETGLNVKCHDLICRDTITFLRLSRRSCNRCLADEFSNELGCFVISTAKDYKLVESVDNLPPLPIGIFSLELTNVFKNNDYTDFTV